MTGFATSTPTLTEFDPRKIPYQYQVIRDVRKNFDYSLGVHQILLSGAVGSAKTILMAHLAVTHCLLNPGAHFGIGRATMPSLKDTLLRVILNHIGGSVGYAHNKVKGSVTFPNGSQILSFSWADGHFKKVRSYEFSGFAIEELTENEEKEFYTEIFMRIGRLKHVQEKFLVSATNPDDPGSHWAYKDLILSKDPQIHTYYSKTRDNPFLPKSYVEDLERNLDPKMALRMLEGQWVSITGNNLYYAYDSSIHFVQRSYVVDPRFPIHFSFDFNIGVGKPMSVCFYQLIGDTYHFFEEVVVEGTRTEAVLDEGAGRGLFDYETTYRVHGDASGKNRDTRSVRSDYDIIRQFLSNYKTRQGRHLNFVMEVLPSNPPLRTRHNLMNAMMKNAKGEVRLQVYSPCKVLDEGFRLTKLKAGGQYIEDDSKYYQHITTAAGYGVCWDQLIRERKPQGTVDF